MARRRAARPVLVKKYGNRRLYDTEESRYVTLDELEARIRAGADVEVVDAKTGTDLTQPTLAQIILEGRGAGRMLPVPLLTRLIRLGDEALAEFTGRWVSGALDVYLQARQGAQTLSNYNPFATMPFDFAGSLARMLLQRGGGGFTAPGYGGPVYGAPPDPAPPAAAPPPASSPEAEAAARSRDQRDQRDQMAELRAELDALKARLGGDDDAPEPGRPPRARKKASRAASPKGKRAANKGRGAGR